MLLGQFSFARATLVMFRIVVIVNLYSELSLEKSVDSH